ncbi:DUF2577 domain-containing protein [Cohnella sp. GCM10012308]|uniref:DUF2577 domain-containing protein n=1 Tax=Cohnella sp. GCM10012308 TaxID=3317329 RepID=UPI00361F0B75
MSINDNVKALAKGYIESLKLADVMYGVVSTVDPLLVLADQRLELDEDFLLVPEHLTEYKVTIGGTEVLIRRALEAGDKVVLIRQQGALNFYVAGRLVE